MMSILIIKNIYLQKKTIAIEYYLLKSTKIDITSQKLNFRLLKSIKILLYYIEKIGGMKAIHIIIMSTIPLGSVILEMKY